MSAGGISEMIEAMAAAGAPLEAILIAVRAIEARDAEINARDEAVAQKRAADAARKRDARASTDSPRTVHGQSVDPLEVSPQTPLPNPDNLTPYSPPKRESRGARLPDHFEVPSEWISYATGKRGWSAAEARDEAENFCRYWQAKAGREARKTDWFKTWQNWVASSRRQVTRAPPNYSQEMPV